MTENDRRRKASDARRKAADAAPIVVTPGIVYRFPGSDVWLDVGVDELTVRIEIGWGDRKRGRATIRIPLGELPIRGRDFAIRAARVIDDVTLNDRPAAARLRSAGLSVADASENFGVVLADALNDPSLTAIGLGICDPEEPLGGFVAGTDDGDAMIPLRDRLDLVTLSTVSVYPIASFLTAPGNPYRTSEWFAARGRGGRARGLYVYWEDRTQNEDAGQACVRQVVWLPARRRARPDETALAGFLADRGLAETGRSVKGQFLREVYIFLAPVRNVIPSTAPDSD